MGQTIYEKILARVSGSKTFKTGDIVWIRPDLIACMDYSTVGKQEQLRQVGLQKLPKPEKLVMVVDHAPEQALGPDPATGVAASFYRLPPGQDLEIADPKKSPSTRRVSPENGRDPAERATPHSSSSALRRKMCEQLLPHGQF